MATEVGAPIHAADIGAQVGQVMQGPGPSKLSVKSLGGFRRGQGRRRRLGSLWKSQCCPRPIES